MDYRALAGARDLAGFQRDFPCFFLVGDVALQRPARSMATISLDMNTLNNLSVEPELETTYLVFPVRKVQPTLQSMISVGRTANNDIVINDVQISKFHALFRIRDDQLELEDAGSVNGTKVGDVPLVKGQPKVVRSGDRVGFGSVEFKLYDSAAAWHALRALP